MRRRSADVIAKPTISIGAGHIFVNFSSDISHFPFRKTRGRHEVGKQGKRKKRASRSKRQIIVLAGSAAAPANN